MRGVWRAGMVVAAWLSLATGCVLNNDEVCGDNMVYVEAALACICVPHSVATDNTCHLCAADEVATQGVCKPASECAEEGSCPDAT